MDSNLSRMGVTRLIVPELVLVSRSRKHEGHSLDITWYHRCNFGSVPCQSYPIQYR